MKKVYSIILFLFITVVVLNAQNKSLLYNENGQLIADSTLSISIEKIHQIIEIEKQFLNIILDKIVYPPICVANDVQADVIAIIKIDSNLNITLDTIIFKDIKNISENFKEDPYIKKTIESLFKSNFNLKLDKHLSETTLHIPLKYLITKETTNKRIEDGWLILRDKMIILNKDNSATESSGTIIND